MRLILQIAAATKKKVATKKNVAPKKTVAVKPVTDNEQPASAEITGSKVRPGAVQSASLIKNFKHEDDQQKSIQS